MTGYVYNYDNIVLAEINRNNAALELFERFLRRAFGHETRVIINHHIVYETRVDGKRFISEIPSADTLIFSPYYMGKVFGPQAAPVMHALVLCPAQEREAHLARELDNLEAMEVLARRQAISRQPLALQSQGAIINVVDESEHNANKV